MSARFLRMAVKLIFESGRHGFGLEINEKQ
jgi:hypothetical protein